MTTKFPSSPVSSRTARLVARPTVSAFLFCRGSTAASRVKTSITTRPYFVFPRVFWLKSMRSACSRSLGPSAADLPSARGRGACTCRPTSAFSASKAMACITSRSRCLASRYSFRGSLTLKSSARSLSASIYNPKRGLSKVAWMRGGMLTLLVGAQDLLSYGGHHLVGPSVVRKAAQRPPPRLRACRRGGRLLVRWCSS